MSVASTTFKMFTALPFELRQHIIQAAFDGSQPSSAAATQLALVCKEFYYVVIPLLYANIRLTTPSALAQFRATLESSSSSRLVPLVHRLHIGPDAPLDKQWWPIRVLKRNRSTSNMLAIILSEFPGQPGDYFTITDVSTDNDAATVALSRAFGAATRDINVNVRHVNKDQSGSDIGGDAWHVRVFELQAAMELYLHEMQRCTDDPLLVVRSGFSTPALGGKRLFQINFGQIYERLAQPGAPTDSFVHPLLFATSGLPWYAVGHMGSVCQGSGTPGRTPGKAVSDVDSLLRVGIPLQLSIGGCLVMAQAVLSRFQRVDSLSLSGCLDWSLLGADSPTTFQLSVHSMSLGPPPDWHFYKLDFASPALYCVEKLRLCEQNLSEGQAVDIATLSHIQQRLRKCQWTMADDLDELEYASFKELMDVVALLISLDEDGSDGAHHRACQIWFGGGESLRDTSDAVEGGEPQRLAIDAHFHRNVVRSIIKAAPSHTVDAQTLVGKTMCGKQHTLTLQDHGTHVVDGTIEEFRHALIHGYEGGRRWWEDE